MVNEKQICGSILVTVKDRERRFGPKDLEFLEKCAAVWGGFLNNARRVQEFFQEPIPDDVLVSKYSALGLLGKSRRFKELIRSVDAASRCDVRVFLEGPSGSGKELVARIIHALGLRSQHPFVALDCGAIPEHLVESELFGHVKGAFTGASQNRKGLMEEAHLGTLFMDEIGNLPYDLQSKLLRAVQEGEVRAIGSNQTRKVDVRIITASRTRAATLLREKTLREDLFYRLHVYPISIPTLNERSEDIPLLAEHFLKVYTLRQKKKVESFHPALVHFMQGKRWQGNVREMENFVERLVTLAESEKTVIDHTLLPVEYQHEFRTIAFDHVDHSKERPLRESLREYEKRILQDTLIAHNWNQSAAARALHISERDMRYKMAELGLRKPEGSLKSID
jgi:transcriptional regulator with PAS, ATPase and Fis domain